MSILETKTPLRSLTMQHLHAWILAIGEVLNTDDCPFSSMDELANQLEYWRNEFQTTCGIPSATQENIKVMLYGNDVILICKECTGEYIKLTQTEMSCTNQEMS